ncbi:MAG: hypothetical protein QOE87_1543 [Gaiellales bacterium]|jgi:glycosyltransferase involved in cell wall biosynthesis|nr:hypothetical protein [Gaiellales bacterium]
MEEHARACVASPVPAFPCRSVPVKLSVVIPTLNEEENLPHLFSRLPAEIHEVILVDGNSSDATVAVARTLCPDVNVVLQDGRGKGNALRCGFEACTGDIIVMLDADGSADPDEIAAFTNALESGADFAKGSRFIKGGGSADITRCRRIGNFVLTRLVNLLFRTEYTDLCYGYNAFWRHCLPVMRIDCDGFEVETLINIRLARSDLRVVEVPSYEEVRLHGTSNLHVVRDGWRVQRTIFTEWLRPVESSFKLMAASPDSSAEMVGQPGGILSTDALEAGVA